VVGGIDCVWDYRAGAPPDLMGMHLPIEETDPICISAARSLRSRVDQEVRALVGHLTDGVNDF
jgi:hypothetical protein